MLEQALKKLDAKEVGGRNEKLMAPAVAAALQDFCRQDPEFAQAVAQGGSFTDCMKAVAKGVGASISDIDAYKRAVKYYFPGADINVKMTINLIGEAMKQEPEDGEKHEGIILSLEDFL